MGVRFSALLSWRSIAVRDHPDLRRALESGSLPEELTDEQGNAWNPRVHLTMHAIVERQIANDDPQARFLQWQAASTFPTTGYGETDGCWHHARVLSSCLKE